MIKRKKKERKMNQSSPSVSGLETLVWRDILKMSSCSFPEARWVSCMMVMTIIQVREKKARK